MRIRTGLTGLVLLSAATLSGLALPYGAQTAAAAGCTAGTESDFNGDGIRDTAIGDPLAAVGGAERAGLVRVVLGGGKGVSEISQATAGMNATPEAGDHFGLSMATYDADADGCTDLVVGAPYEDIPVGGANLVDAGAVYVIHGSVSGIGTGSPIDDYSQQGFDPTTATEANDWFGFALAAGKTSSGQPYLAIGVPGENVGDVADAGGIHYAQATTKTTVTEDDAGVPGAAEAHDRFGYALTATPRYLAVAAPGESIGDKTFAGGVAVFNHTLTNGVPTALAGLDQEQPGISGSAETGDGFGTAISLAPYRPSGAASETDVLLAIGVPNEDVGTAADAGLIQVVQIPSSGAYKEVNAADRGTTDVEGDPTAGDFFGQRVAIANTAPGSVGTAATMKLAVGVPGHDVTGASDAGAVQVLPALGAAGASDKILARGGGILPGTAAQRDFAGMGLAVSATDLYVGVPYGKSAGESSGVVYVLPWAVAGGGTGTVRTLKPGADGIPDAGRSFGAVIR
ncbi:integrin alpha [Streptomyces sp. Pv4-95]|uniref:integrin alpha n=1 Tax=Streptomyces sp. Pv4-95 TaxID=3049543 RepID=UPI00389265FF